MSKKRRMVCSSKRHARIGGEQTRQRLLDASPLLDAQDVQSLHAG
jgi:hypothetical protein